MIKSSVFRYFSQICIFTWGFCFAVLLKLKGTKPPTYNRKKWSVITSINSSLYYGSYNATNGLKELSWLRYAIIIAEL